MLFTDADLSSPIHEADKLFAAIRQGADVAIGSRRCSANCKPSVRPWYRQLYGRSKLALRVVLGLKYRDTQCGFKALHASKPCRRFSPGSVMERWGFDPELLFLADK